MISLVLVDAELERVPQPCTDGGMPRVCSVSDGQLRGIMVLDSYIHRHLMEGLDDAGRRGRPDIVHSFLLLAQGSPACREGRLRAYVHTRTDEVILIGRDFSPERSYVPFLRTMSELVAQGQWGSGEAGLRMEGLSLRQLLSRLAPEKVVALSPVGKERHLRAALSDAARMDVAILIGGFPEGDYASPVYQMADVTVSLGEELLTVPDVTAQVLAALP